MNAQVMKVTDVAPTRYSMVPREHDASMGIVLRPRNEHVASRSSDRIKPSLRDLLREARNAFQKEEYFAGISGQSYGRGLPLESDSAGWL
jgi:hypothetical protein